MYGADVDGGAEGVKGGLGLGVERRLVGGEGYASFSEIWLDHSQIKKKEDFEETYFAILMGSTPALLYIFSRVRESGVSCKSFHFCCASSRVWGSHSSMRSLAAC